MCKRPSIVRAAWRAAIGLFRNLSGEAQSALLTNSLACFPTAGFAVFRLVWVFGRMSLDILFASVPSAMPIAAMRRVFRLFTRHAVFYPAST